MSIYSNDNIRKIAKLTTRELPQKSKNAEITVRENNGLYSILPYFGKRKQVKVKFLVKEHNVAVISTDVNGILCLTYMYITYLIGG